jgi:hypothetical protein
VSFGAETLTAISIASSVLGAGVSIIGQGQQAAAQRASLEYQAAVSRNNQILAERQAADATERGRIAERNQRVKAQQLAGRQRAVLAGNGVVVDEGSALDITSDTAAMGEQDALTIRANAEREALGFRTQGMNFGAQAGLQSMQAANTSATMGQIGTAFGAIGSVADRWYRYKNPTSPTAAV